MYKIPEEIVAINPYFLRKADEIWLSKKEMSLKPISNTDTQID